MGDLSSFAGRLGNPDQAMEQIDVGRGVIPGKKPKELEGLDPETLALLDRLAWGKQNQEHFGRIPSVLTGLATVAPYEAVKGAAQSDNPVLNTVGQGALSGAEMLFNALGGKGDEMTLGANSSPASLANVMAYLYGAAR